MDAESGEFFEGAGGDLGLGNADCGLRIILRGDWVRVHVHGGSFSATGAEVNQVYCCMFNVIFKMTIAENGVKINRYFDKSASVWNLMG